MSSISTQTVTVHAYIVKLIIKAYTFKIKYIFLYYS